MELGRCYKFHLRPKGEPRQVLINPEMEVVPSVHPSLLVVSVVRVSIHSPPRALRPLGLTPDQDWREGGACCV